MDSLNRAEGAYSTALSSHVGCCNPQPVSTENGWGRAFLLFWLCRPSNPSNGQWMAVIDFFFFFGTTPSLYLFVQFIQLLVCTHTLYLCGARGFVRNIRSTDLRGLRFPAEQITVS